MQACALLCRWQARLYWWHEQLQWLWLRLKQQGQQYLAAVFVVERW